MPVRILAAWLALLAVAIANGGFREAVLVPRIGSGAAHVASTLMLGAAILGVTYLLISWIRPPDARSSLEIGVIWLVLTLLFEFGFGRFRGMSWTRLLADYDLTRGRIWVLIPIVTALAPWLAGRARGLFGSNAG